MAICDSRGQTLYSRYPLPHSTAPLSFGLLVHVRSRRRRSDVLL